jgi:iron complex outermembrane receptor protein
LRRGVIPTRTPQIGSRCSGLQAGNANLKAEEGDTWTFGLVFQGPGNLEGLTASIDVYNIEIDGAIGTFSANTIYEQCFNSNGISNPGYTINDPLGFCGLINRGANGGTGTVDLTFLNTGFVETSGVDLAVNWATDLASGGTFYIRNLVTAVDKFDTQELPGDPIRSWAGTLSQGGQYDYRINTTLG